MSTRSETTFKKLAKKYRTPKQVQAFLRKLNYNHEKKSETVRSAFSACQAKETHCLEACFVAAAILEQNGYPPLLLCMDSSDNINHCVYLFETKTGWGSIGRSRLPGLHGRQPVFKTVEELVLSYTDAFVDATGHLIGWHVMSLDDAGADWRASKRNVWKVDHYTVSKKYKKLTLARKRLRKLRHDFLTIGPIPSGKYWW